MRYSFTLLTIFLISRVVFACAEEQEYTREMTPPTQELATASDDEDGPGDARSAIAYLVNADQIFQLGSTKDAKDEYVEALITAIDTGENEIIERAFSKLCDLSLLIDKVQDEDLIDLTREHRDYLREKYPGDFALFKQLLRPLG